MTLSLIYHIMVIDKVIEPQLILMCKLIFCLLSKQVLTVCSYHVTYTFHSESTLYKCLNVKELLAWNRRKIWSLSDCNRTRPHNHLVCKETLNHLAKLASLAKSLSVCLQTKWLWGRVPLQLLKQVLIWNLEGCKKIQLI